MLDVHLVYFIEETFDALVVPIVVHHHKPNLAGCDKGRHEPLIEFIDGLQIHLIGFPFVFVD